MLHQYSEQPVTDLGTRYSSPLSNCSSYLLNQSCSEASEVNELSNCSFEDDFLSKNPKCVDEYRGSQSQNVFSFDVESVVAVAKAVELQSSNCRHPFEEVVSETKEKFNNTNQCQLVEGEQNNNVWEVVNDECQKSKSCPKNNEITPQADTEAKLSVPPPQSNAELKEKANLTGGGGEICDENESNSRLPGFHQAFGSTEIGRFVHQKDFIEQINQRTSFVASRPPSLSLVPCSSSLVANSIINNSSSSKIRSRYNKRLKMPTHSLPPPAAPTTPSSGDIMRNMSSWSNYEYDADPTVNAAMSFQSSNAGSNYYNKYRDTRTKRNQYLEGGPVSAYCNNEDYYNCSSAYYYGGGCSDNVNCDYYRYQQNSSYYHNGYSTYHSNLHTGYTNGYHHNQRYNSMMNGDMACALNQNCQVDKYYSSYNEEQLPYHYDKQSSNTSTYHQYQPYMSHNQHQLASPATYNYNAYNSYTGTPISSFNYY